MYGDGSVDCMRECCIFLSLFMFGVDIGDDFVLLLLARAALNASKSIVSDSGNGAAIAEEGSMRPLMIVVDTPTCKASRRLNDFVLIGPCDNASTNGLMMDRINSSIAIMMMVVIWPFSRYMIVLTRL